METDWEDLLEKLRDGEASARDVRHHVQRLLQDLVATQLVLTKSERSLDLYLYINEIKTMSSDLLKRLDKMNQGRDGACGMVSSMMNSCLNQGGWDNDGDIISSLINKLSERGFTTLTEEMGSAEDLPPYVPKGLLPRGWTKDVRNAIGFEDDEDKLVNMLLAENAYKGCIISIVGMGSPGLSALVYRILTNPRVKSHFQYHTLVNLSQTYHTQSVLDSIKGQFMGSLPPFLTQKRYLVVLHNVWEPIRDILKGLQDWGNGRNRVLITTQRTNISALGVTPVELYQPHPLTECESWDLFKKHFPSTAEACTPEKKKWILEEYGGMPLSLKAVGRALEEDSRSPQRDITLGPIPIDDHTYHVLNLGYKHLGSTPRRLCFLYLTCLIPRGGEINAEKLVCLWVAESFLDVDGERVSDMEEMARGVLKSFIQCGMVRVEEKFTYGTGSVMVVHHAHPIMHDAYIPKAKEAGFFDVCTPASRDIQMNAPRQVLRQHLPRDYVSKKFSNVSESFPASSLQTLMGFALDLDMNCKSLPNIQSLHVLRVLELENTRLRGLPDEIGKMVHLRYLGLRGTLLKSIPSSIGNLHSLQTLDVRVTFIQQLPSDLWKISSMRHIFLDPIVRLQGIGTHLTNLQTLKVMSAQEWKTNSHSLSHTTNLRSLAIRIVRKDHHSAIVDSLGKLSFLQDLYLAGDSVPTEIFKLKICLYLRVLSLLGKLPLDVPYWYYEWPMLHNLQELNLYCSKLQQDPMRLFERLPRLRCLRLHDAYTGEKLECQSGGFPSLEQLYLASLVITSWDLQSGAMSSLRDLTIKACNKLEGLPNTLREMTTIQSLELQRSPNSLKMHVQKGGIDWSKIEQIYPKKKDGVSSK